jgi:hypothetical protein
MGYTRPEELAGSRNSPKNKGRFALQVEGRFALPLTGRKIN